MPPIFAEDHRSEECTPYFEPYKLGLLIPPLICTSVSLTESHPDLSYRLERLARRLSQWLDDITENDGRVPAIVTVGKVVYTAYTPPDSIAEYVDFLNKHYDTIGERADSHYYSILCYRALASAYEHYNICKEEKLKAIQTIAETDIKNKKWLVNYREEYIM